MVAKNEVKLSLVRIDGGTQPRREIDQSVVADYAERIKAGDTFPLCDVFFDGAEYWLADGFHRYHGYKSAGQKMLPSNVHSGTQRDAILFSCGANRHHGLRRTNEDKRTAVSTVLADAEWSQWSNRRIADACGVSDKFVAEIRDQLRTVRSSSGEVGPAPAEPEVRIGRDGKKRRSSGKPRKPRKPQPPKKNPSTAVSEDLTAANIADETEPEVELSTAEKMEADNKLIESFCRELVQFFENNVPHTHWTSADGRIGSALSSLKAGCSTLRTAKSVLCPACEDGINDKGNACPYCNEVGYLPKMKADQVARVN